MSNHLEVAALNLGQQHHDLEPELVNLLTDMARTIERLQREGEQIKKDTEILRK